jgi:hypothetical protein
VTGVFALPAIPPGIASRNKLFSPAVVAEFCALYPNRVQAILRPVGCKSWTTISKHWPLSDEAIVPAVSGQERTVYGLRWGNRTRFAVLDVDAGGKYHSAQGLEKLRKTLAGVNLTATVYQSSESGGWHVYLFFDQWEASNEVQETVKAWLVASGYEIRGGQLEVFPSGNGLRLPLQPGFAWLDDTGAVLDRRETLTTDEAISRFLNDLKARANNWDKAKSLITTQLEALDRVKSKDAQAHKERLTTAGFEHVFNYRLIPEKYEEGRSAWRNGLTSKGQRHDAILGIEHYLWHGDESINLPALPGEWNDEGRYRLILAWLEKNHNGFCNHINRGNWRKVEAQIRRAVNWRRPLGGVQVRTPYQLTERVIERLIGLSKSTGRVWTMEDLQKGNIGRELEARERIREAVQLLESEGEKVTCRALMRLARCSYHTVRRHLDIWRISPAVALTRAAGEMNPSSGLDLPCSTTAPVVYLNSSVPDPVVVLRKESFLSSCVAGDSGNFGLNAFVQGDRHKESPPFLSCLARSLPPNPQHQDRALRVPSAVLTPGPRFDGIQAEGQEGAGGGIFSMSSPWVLARSRKRGAAVIRSEAEPRPHEKIVKLVWREKSLYRAVRQDKGRWHAPTRAPPVDALGHGTGTQASSILLS